ncbi:MAG: 3-isopropylmalate dehydratase large subunit [Candidatus Lokiarchaeota archaeon]|nr:3-isopropylmalate dehydratase large subunit [Candidatus Harpocratesius repetitus]
MSISDKILAKHISSTYTNKKNNIETSKIEKSVTPGEFIQVSVDYIMVHEQLGGRIAPEFQKLGLNHIWDPEQVVFILDHWVPPPDVRAAKMHQRANTFAEKYHIKWNFGQNQGICHQVLPEKGFAQPGRLIVGSDSHTTTYGAFNCFSTGIGATDVVNLFATGELWFVVPETIRVNFHGNLHSNVLGKDIVLQMLRDFKTDGAIYDGFEFGGEGISQISIDSRMTISNMVVEMGAKNGIFEGDKLLADWLRAHPPPTEAPSTLQTILQKSARPNSSKTSYSAPISPNTPRFISPEKGYNYKKTLEYDLSEIEPMIARPYSPDNVIPVAEMEPIEIDEAFLGSCTNGRLEDLRIAARIVKNHTVPTDVKFIVIPASRDIYLKAMHEGLLEIFVQAGAMVEYPTCGPCIGGHMGVLGPDEICISSSNRNFKGRMGDPSSQTYLASSATVAASAITGHITSPPQEKTRI